MPIRWHNNAIFMAQLCQRTGNDSLKAIHTHLNKKKTDQFL